MRCEFIIPGKAQGKGRPRFTRTGHAFTPQSTRDYENLVKKCYIEQCGSYMFNEPVEIEIKAYFGIPQSYSKKKRNELLNTAHTQTPDLDNVIKSITDGLQGAAYTNDSFIAKILAVKNYSLTSEVIVTLRDL